MKDILKAENEEILVMDSDEQHMEDIVVFSKGHNKFYPYQGAEVQKYVKGQDLRRLNTAVIQNLEADGVKDLSVKVTDGGQLSINGHY